MQIDFSNIVLIILAVLCVCSFGYLVFSIVALERFHRQRRRDGNEPDFRPPVTLFKPVCGLDPEMLENLRSFCRQDYPEYQVIFGLQDQDDPALEVIKKVIEENPDVDIRYVLNPMRYGSNHKVSNLINMYPGAKHDYLLIADSDMQVPEDYLANVMAPFADAKIGAVTCVYSGSARGGITSFLNAMFINEWFLPSVLISEIIQKTRFCLGATMVVRRDILEGVGGFAKLKDHLADDYMLGQLVADAGYDIHLSHFVVENIVSEPDLRSLVLHELRWARTLKTVEPLGYRMTFLTDTLVIAAITGLVAMPLTGQILWPAAGIGLVFLTRLLLHRRANRILGIKEPAPMWLVPVRDLLSFAIRVVSFTGNSIHWRNHDFSVDRRGLIHDSMTVSPRPIKVDELPDLATNEEF